VRTFEVEVLEITERIYFDCPEDPGRLLGLPIGMYHCGYCGCMTIAGISAHPHEEYCGLGLWEWEEWN
jgi:hypothetical protein